MNEKLAKAWELFDAGNYTDAESLYRECLEQFPSTDHEAYWQALMGLIYVESFLKNFKEARSYVALLLSSTIDNEEKHIALHQAGMTERMAEDYEKAMDYILQEEAVIRGFHLYRLCLPRTWGNYESCRKKRRSRRLFSQSNGSI